MVEGMRRLLGCGGGRRGGSGWGRIWGVCVLCSVMDVVCVGTCGCMDVFYEVYDDIPTCREYTGVQICTARIE